MEAADNNTLTTNIVGQSDMGNDLSHSEGVKQSVGGEGHTGQFHKVFCEPQLSQASDVIAADEKSSDDIHNQTTLKIRGGSTEKIDNATSTVHDPPDVTEEDYKLIEKCKALITEAADRAVERPPIARPSCSEQVTDLDELSHDEVEDDEEFSVKPEDNATNKQINEEIIIDATYSNIETFPDKKQDNTSDLANGKKQKSSKTGSPKKSKDYALKCGIVTESAFEGNTKSETKAKRKQKADKIKSPTASPSHKLNKKGDITSEQTDVAVKQSQKRNPLANMFKFSKRKSKDDITSDTNVTKIESIEEVSVSKDNANTNDISSGVVCNNEETNGNSIDHNAVIKRLNSLDSGIVVDKVSEHQNVGGVEYAVVQKKKPKREKPSKTNDSSNKSNDKDKTDSEQTIGKANGDGSEAVYINGNKDDQDFVYINERAIDVSGLVEPVTSAVSEAIPHKDDAGGSDLASERSGNEAEIQSILSSDSGASSGAKYKVSDKTKPEKAKLKKKSWSFQVLGRKDKKSSDGLDTDSGSRVSMDPSAASPEKKSKWLFGKFSFRRSSDDMTSSTPNLQQAGIPEEQETNGVKSKSKTKKKSKDKKRKSPKKDLNSLERRSTSLMDIIVGDANQPRSRRSIIEDDLEFTPTDAFEGVTLSDLSQDEEAEAEVTLNPEGGKIKEKNSKTDKKGKSGKSKSPAEAVADNQAKIVAKVKPLVDEIIAKASAKASNEPLDADQYMNVADVEKVEDTVVDGENKLRSEIIEDDYVNVLADHSEAVPTGSGSSDQVERIEVGGDEYAIVNKKLNVAESTDDKDAERINTEKHEEELMKEYGLDKSQIQKDSQEEHDSETEQAEEIVVPVSSEKAYSNMIYSDEEFNASLSKLTNKAIEADTSKETLKEQTDDVNAETPAELDEYVQLKEITQDKNIENTETETKATSSHGKDSTEQVEAKMATDIENEQENRLDNEGNKNVEDGNNVSEKTSENMSEGENKSGAVSETEVVNKTEAVSKSEVENKSEAENEGTDTERVITTTVKTLVMKDIGVQVPDIHMPLDIDADFGHNVGKVTSSSIGIQVECNDLDDISHVVVTMATNKEAPAPSEV